MKAILFAIAVLLTSVVNAQEFRVFIENQSDFKSSAVAAIAEIETYSALNPKYVTDPNQARGHRAIRIYFQPHAKMLDRGTYYRGLAWRQGVGGYIFLHETEFAKMSSRVRLQMVEHEVLHLLGIAHPKDAKREDLMHPWCGVYPRPQTIIDVQRRVGKPDTEFYPLPRVRIAQAIAQIRKERKQHIANRDSSTDKAYRTKQQNLNLSKMAKEIDFNKKYWTANNRYRNVPMAHDARK